MTAQQIVTREDWLVARKALLEKERDLTHRRDAINAVRRALPWVRIEKDYQFDTPEGPKALADLFEGRSQLAVYHFMLAPDSEHICDGCALLADHVDGARQHFEQADLSFVAVSRAPLTRIAQVKQRMGWAFRWVSSGKSDFNYDFGVSFTPEQIEAGTAEYNFGVSPHAEPDLPGTSIFVRDDSGAVFHTYSSYARGGESLLGAFAWLDLTPKGRNEHGVMSWVRLHDEYAVGQTASSASCCG